MALIQSFTKLTKDRQTVHKPVDCGYTVIEGPEGRVLQLDTYGSTDRKFEGKTSQSVQLDAAGAGQLLSILRSTFPQLD